MNGFSWSANVTTYAVHKCLEFSSLRKGIMTTYPLVILGAVAGATLFSAQQAPPANSDPATTPVGPSRPAYTPPTHAEKFQTYLRHTYGIGSILEAGVRAGIDQALDRPSEWPQGAQGYGERFGSAMGAHVARGTTSYLFGELFHEDLRYVHCTPNCSASNRIKVAFENTFTAAKGEDGHREFSVSRFIGPISGCYPKSVITVRQAAAVGRSSDRWPR
jgi:hypothetical protein